MAFRRCIAPPRFLAFVRAKIVRDKEMNATPTWYGIRGIKTGHDTIGPTTRGAMSKFADAAHRPIQSIRKRRRRVEVAHERRRTERVVRKIADTKKGGSGKRTLLSRQPDGPSRSLAKGAVQKW
ncbi:hypothetical protein EDB84DRAFT_1446320 [Lactarius hengduanensis]|nr:hypothetical protein EDB84DRAFT_1446320 [Lactarius hengduanensis]